MFETGKYKFLQGSKWFLNRIQWEPENCGKKDNIKAMIKFVWCCYKAISFTNSLIIHLFREIGQFTLHNFHVQLFTLNSILQGGGHDRVPPPPLSYGPGSNRLDLNLCFYLRLSWTEWMFFGSPAWYPDLESQSRHTSRGCNVSTFSLQGNLSRFISSCPPPPLP